VAGFERSHARCGCASTGARPFPFASTPRNFERDRPFRVKHLALEIDLEVSKKSIRATATLDVERVDPSASEIVLDAVGFVNVRVKVDGKSTQASYDGRQLRVPLGKSKKAEISISYGATPRRGMYFIEPDEHYPKRPRQVWTQCQEEDARHWVPCHDKPHMKMTTEITATVPNGWHVLSNGALASSDQPKKGTWRFHWKMDDPHPSYLLTLVAGEFSILDAKAGKTPVTYWVPKGKEGDGKRTFKRTPEMIELFSKLTGVNYPWNKYAQIVVTDFIFGGMENTTATTMYEHILLDAKASLDITSDDIIAHELAHQWFGDYVTCREWYEGWLNEGFATFFEHVWRERDLGEDEYHYGLESDRTAYVGEAHGRYRRPIVCQDYDAPLDLFDRHLYEKGALVLHLLRQTLGNDLFWRGIHGYLKARGGGIVETRDLERAMEEASGKSLGKFFEQWVHKPGHPECEITITHEDEVLTVHVRQHQSSHDGVPAAFDFPLVLDVIFSGGKSRREELRVTQAKERFAVPCAERPRFVVVDPEMQILGDVEVKAPLDMLRTQLESAETARGRWLAAQALSKSDDPATIGALEKVLGDEKEFWGVRAESADCLGKIRARECFDALEKHARTRHPKVRRAVVAALGRFKSSRAAELLKPHALRDESYMVESEAARALGKTRQHIALDVLIDVVDRSSWADIVAVGALDGLAALRDDRAIPHVLARTRYGHPTRMRRAAILSAAKLSTDRRTREALEDLLDDPDPYTRVDVARALGDIGDSKSRPALRSRLEVDLDPRVRRRIREVLRDLGGDGKKGLDQLREELDKIRDEHAELRGRIAKIEARALKKKKKK